MPRWYAVIALLALIALSGCAEPAGSIHMKPVEDINLASEVSQSTTDEAIFPAIRQQQVVSEAIKNGSTSVADLRKPVDDSYHYHYQGQYYKLSTVSVTQVPGVSLSIAIDKNATELRGPRLDFADLNATDQRLLRPVLDHEPFELEEGADAKFPIAIRDANIDNSSIITHADSSVVLDYRGTKVQLILGEVQEETLRLFTYEASLVAENSTAYETYLTDQYVFTISDRSQDEQTVLDSATGDSYYAESTDDNGFGAIVDRFLRHRAIYKDEYSGVWLVRYQGTTYLTELNFGQFVDDKTVTTRTPNVTPH